MKTQRIFLAFIAVALLLAVMLVRFLLGESAATRAADVTDVASPNRSEATLEIAGAEPITDRSASSMQRSAIAASSDIATSASALGAGGVRIVVVKHGTSEPVAGAHVSVLEKAGVTLSLGDGEDGWLGPDVEAAIERGGRARTTNEHGELTLPLVRTNTFVAARKDDLFGILELARASDETLVLELDVQHDLHVKVVDARGAARARAVVALGWCGQSTEAWRAHTDARGELTIRNTDYWLAYGGLSDETTFSVRLSTPCDPPVEEWISPKHLPTEPIVLIEPATGSVQLRVVDAIGNVVPIGGHATVRARTNARGVGVPYAFDSIDVRAPIVAGIAKFESVGLGLQLDFEADINGTGDASVSAPGPTASGEQVQAMVALPEDHCVLTGRVVDENGRVLSDNSFDWKRIVDDGQSIAASGRDVLHTDREGRFAWTLRRVTSANGLGESAHRIGFLCELSTAPIRRAKTIDFSRSLPAGSLELGDIVLAPHGPLVSGKVLDEAEHAVVGARLALTVGSGEAETYDECTSDVDGTFAIWGPCLPLEFTLSAWSAGHSFEQGPHFRCTDGTTEIVVHAKALGSIEGSALVDHEYEGTDLPLVLSKGDSDVTADLTFTRVLDRITFARQGLSAGKYRAFVSTEGAGPIVEFMNVEIVVGQCTRDPRLVDIDLRGKLPKAEKALAAASSVELTVVDAHGKSVSRGFLWLRDPAGGQDEMLWGAGHVRLATNEQRSVEIWSPGHRSTLLHPPYADARIVLASELVAEIAVVIPKALQAPNISFFVNIGPVYATNEAAENAPIASARLQGFELANGRGELHLPAAGRYELSLSLTRHSPNPDLDIDGYGLSFVTSEIVVRETDGAQRFELRLVPDEVAACIETLGVSNDQH